jgi:hypothetical protein
MSPCRRYGNGDDDVADVAGVAVVADARVFLLVSCGAR